MQVSSRGRRSAGLAQHGSWAAAGCWLLAGAGAARAADAASAVRAADAASAVRAAEAAGSGAAPWWFATAALVAVVLAAVAGMLYGTLRGERRLGAALRASQRERQGLQQLLDVWSWQTDAQHRLLHLHPPAGSPADAWSQAPAPGQLLWDCFEVTAAAEVAGLRARLESQAAFSDLAVHSQDAHDAWTLRATARWDEEGRFAGHAGTARQTGPELAPQQQVLALQQQVLALQNLLCEQPGPALLATAAAVGGWQLRHANADALRWLGADATAALPPWGALLERLPEAVQQAIGAADTGPGENPVAGSASAAARAEPADGDSAGWRLRRATGADGRQLALLLVRPVADPAAAGPPDDPNESESFGYTLSHDLRAPIRVVDGFTRIVKEDYGRLLDRVGNDHLDRVLSAAARMNLMIDALLALARLSSLPLARQPVNLTQLAGFVLDDLRRAAPERAADIDVQSGLQVVGDPTLLRLVLENLLGNAWKYSAKVARARISFGVELQDGRRVFAVRDNGAGFDMRSADRLFGLFQRLHSANDFAGTGVGLASVQRIVRRHGGQVWAEGEPGRGAAFYFTLRG